MLSGVEQDTELLSSYAVLVNKVCEIIALSNNSYNPSAVITALFQF